MANFGERLARLIHERGWTQVEAAEKLGVSQALISHYLSGKREPLPRTISHLAERLGVTIDVLMGEGKHKTAQPGSSSKKSELVCIQVMQQLKRRWKRSKRDRATMRHLVAALFTDDADDVLTWFDDRAGPNSGIGTGPEK
jgi:transcriptional regulator with XRE-family HTH domain